MLVCEKVTSIMHSVLKRTVEKARTVTIDDVEISRIELQLIQSKTDIEHPVLGRFACQLLQ